MEILRQGVGDQVSVRQRTWIIHGVENYDACRVLTLAAAGRRGDRDGDGTFQIIHPFDEVADLGRRTSPARVGIREWRHACRALIASTAGADSLRTAATARLDMLPYQFEPALAMLAGRGSRVLIADEVGLGKTIQALLAIAELRHRGVVARTLVMCPAGVRQQWVEEAVGRFGVNLTLVDQKSLKRARQRLPSGINPWVAHPFAVASIDLVKRPEVLPSVLSANWDAVVVDEAHGACGASDRYEAVSQLCERAPYVLLLTATPHNGDDKAFSTLCGLGQHSDTLVVFRRSRLEAGRDSGRRLHIVTTAASPAERRMHAALGTLTRAIRDDAPGLDRHAWLMLALLHKRALSCPHALARSAERRLCLLGDAPGHAYEQLTLPLDDEAGELDGADAAPMWDMPALKDPDKERALLRKVAASARQAEAGAGKLRRLRRLLARLKEPVIVFTEYRDTLLHLRDQVAPHAALVHGGMTGEERKASLDAFASCGVLLATDAAGEGLNLQHHCRVVVNLELPWNPMRLEQRIGRVDRIGQQRTVHVFHFVSGDTGEARLLGRLAARVSGAQARVGAPDPLRGRAAWSEDASARLIVLNESPDAATEPFPPADGAVPLTRLTSEAAREAERVRMIRQLHVASQRAGAASHRTRHNVRHASSPLLAHTRRCRLRVTLGARALAVIRTAIRDGGGHEVAVRVEAAMLAGAADWNSANERLNEPDGWRAWHNWQDWADESVRLHTRMTEVRLRRAVAIAALFDRSDREWQPGLFDRRWEQETRQRQQERDEARDAASSVAARAAAALDVSVSGPELRLLLVPGAGTMAPAEQEDTPR